MAEYDAPYQNLPYQGPANGSQQMRSVLSRLCDFFSNRKVIYVKGLFDSEAGVWIATSDDLRGLVLEDENLDRLLERLPGAIADLIEENSFEAAKDAPKSFQFLSQVIDISSRNHVGLHAGT